MVQFLATNVILYDVGVRPKLLKEKERKNLLIKLSLLFPELDLNKIRSKLDKKDFFSIGKRLTPKTKDQFWLMGNKAFVFDPKPSRIYPQKIFLVIFWVKQTMLMKAFREWKNFLTRI